MIQEKLTQLTPSLNEETFHLYSDVNMLCLFIFDILVFSQMFKNILFTTTKKKTSFICADAVYFRIITHATWRYIFIAPSFVAQGKDERCDRAF